MIILAVVGTKVLACPGDTVRVAKYTRFSIEHLKPVRVVSGGARGVDMVAEMIAKAMGYNEADGSLTVYRPTVQRFHGSGGYRERDGYIASDCTHLLRLSCRHATTYGSGWTADEAQRLGKVVARKQVCP